MPSVVDKKCPLCGQRHKFYIAADAAAGSKMYAFTCPNKSLNGAIAFPADADWTLGVQGRPRGAVDATPIEAKR